MLDGNIGYMRLVGLAARPASEEAAAATFAFLHHSDALIIDNRENYGGDPHPAMLYLSYLVDRAPFVVLRMVGRDGAVLEELGTTDLGELRYGARKPVYVLLSRRSFSGGVGVAYRLRRLGRAVLIGEPATRGKGFREPSRSGTECTPGSPGPGARRSTHRHDHERLRITESWVLGPYSLPKTARLIVRMRIRRLRSGCSPET